MPITRIDGSGVDFSSAGLSSPSITSGDLILNRINDGFDFSIVLSSAANALNRNVIFQASGGGPINGNWQFRGRVLKPDMPVAVVSFSTPTYNSFTWGSNANIIPDVLGTNSTAGFYSTSTGRFTAPVTGWYHIFLSLMCNPPSSNANRLVLRLNDADYNIGGGAFDVIQPAHGVAGGSAGSPQSNIDLTAMVRLTAGQYLSFAARAGTSVGPVYGGHSWGFCYLVG
jgi:hypothetical protein